VFIFFFLNTEAGLYLVLFSMLLSPEFALGGGGLAERRCIVVRLEDLLLIAIALSWFAKTAVNKEIGLVVKTPLNPWILFYVLSAFLSTALGYLQNTVKSAIGFMYVLKYVEYFVVYYMTVNHVRDRAQARRLIMAALVTAASVSVIGAAQIPSGQRVPAPWPCWCSCRRSSSRRPCRSPSRSASFIHSSPSVARPRCGSARSRSTRPRPSACSRCRRRSRRGPGVRCSVTVSPAFGSSTRN